MRKQGYKDWEKIVNKLKSDIKLKDNLIIDLNIATEMQENALKYAEKRLLDYPKTK